MKKLFLLLILLPAMALAEPVSFNFNDVSLIAFCQATFKNVLHFDYVVAPEALSMDRKITVHVSKIELEKVPEFVQSILLQQGIASVKRDGVYYLSSAQKSSSSAGADAPTPSSGADLSPKSHDINSAGIVDEHGEAAGGIVRRADDESEVYVPQNRPSDFLVTVVAAGFGKRAASTAGSVIVLVGSKTDLGKMRALLESVDALPKMVDVSASWVEVTDNTGSGRGISVLANMLGAKFGVQLGSVSSGSAVSLKNTNFQLVIDALNTDGRFKQVSNSRVVGDDYEKLVLTVGDETPTISSTGKDNAGNTVQNVVYRPSGVIVDVLPKVLGSGRIQLIVDGQISSFKTTATGVASSPTLIKRQVKTKVTVADGDVLLIGGLNDTQETSSSSALSFLPASWSAKSNSTARTDLVLVLSAKVAKQ